MNTMKNCSIVSFLSARYHANITPSASSSLNPDTAVKNVGNDSLWFDATQRHISAIATPVTSRKDELTIISAHRSKFHTFPTILTKKFITKKMTTV